MHALNGKRSGRGYIARCPAHDDEHPSLSINARGGRILVKCHAGCSQNRVLAALRDRGLWPEADLKAHRGSADVVYVYKDENGRPIHRVKRTATKRFFQEHLVGGKWVPGAGERIVLYHLDELLGRQHEPVYIAEGEKDVDRLRQFGLLATCNPMGAGKWRDQFSAYVAGRDVYVFFDRDPASKAFRGQIHAADVALSLTAVGAQFTSSNFPVERTLANFWIREDQWHR